MTVSIQGLRGTGQFDNDHRPKNYREFYTLLEPNGDAPLNALLSMTNAEATDDPEYKNFRDELPARAFQVNNGAGYDANATTITCDAVDALNFVVAGSIIVNVRTGEVMHATASPSGADITVDRNIGGSAFTIVDNDDLIVAGFAAAEGADTPTPMSFDAETTTNYTQIFRQAFSVSGTLDATNLRTGSKWDEQMEKALKLHMQDIERSMFFGRKHEKDGNTAEPTRFTGGLFETISRQTDATATANKITEEEFDDLLISTIFEFGSKQKIAFVGAKVAGHLQQFGKDRWQPETVDGTYGVSVTRYKTFAGDLMVHLHPQFRQIPGMENSMVILDFPDLCYRYLQGRDTHLLQDRQGNGEDRKKAEYMTECGLELKQDKTHHVIRNWDLRK